MDTVVSAGLISLAAAVTVGLWTFRIALAARGRRLLSAAIAGFEAVLFVLIFTGLVASLGDPIRLAAYAIGVASGTLVGLVADERLSSGQSEVRLIVAGSGSEVTARLHAAGWPATSTPAMGPSGRATSVFVAVDDRRVPDLLALVERLEPVPFVTVGRLRQTRSVRLPSGFVQVGQRSSVVMRHRDADTLPTPALAAAASLSAPAPAEPARTDPDIAIRDLRLASAELGEALAVTEPAGAVALAVASWLAAVASRLGRDLRGLPPTPVLLARGHAVVGRALLSAVHVPDAPALAARARGLTAALQAPTGGAR